MKKLFYSRLVLYTAAVSFPLFHPAVAVTYDRISFIAYLVIVPLYMLFAFYARTPRVSRKTELFLPLSVLVLLVAVSSGFSRDAFVPVIAALVSYASTRFIFSESGRGPSIATLEVFVLGAIYYRVLEFSRSSEDLAKQSEAWSSFLIVFSISAFLIHCVILYLASFPDRTKGRARKELAIFLSLLLFIALPIAFLLPKDFIKHDIVFNNLNESPPPNPRPLDGNSGEGMLEGGSPGARPKPDTRNGKPLGSRPEKFPSELNGGSEHQGGGGQPQSGGEGGGGSGQSAQQQNGQSGKKKKQKGPALEGVASDDWDNLDASGKGKGKQKAVMVIASPVNPVYAAERYLGDLDPEKGFQFSDQIKLNRLGTLRLLDTWKNLERNDDAMRKSVEIFYLSTIKNRVVSYMPSSIEPTVMDKRYHPFDLSYRAASAISVSTPDEWKTITGLSYEENEQLRPFLEVPLSEGDLAVFKSYLSTVLKGSSDGYFDRIHAILKSYEKYQYEMGFDDNMTIRKVKEFLTKTRTGDCTEFAHTTALLARLAGIPSRVVEGYIASKDLQTPAHAGGIKNLRQKIPLLQKFPMSDLYLVTTSHHHVWVQLYLPGFGWVDFETTSYAKPPKPSMDPNAMDVIIPMIEESPAPPLQKTFVFPWRLFLIGLGGVIFVLLCGLYGYRYGKEFLLARKTKRDTPEGLEALMTLLLIRLAVNGYPLKEPYRTPKEYAGEFERISAFAELYTMLRFRSVYGAGEKEGAWLELRTHYAKLVRGTKKKGFTHAIRRIVSLRGLYY